MRYEYEAQEQMVQDEWAEKVRRRSRWIAPAIGVPVALLLLLASQDPNGSQLAAGTETAMQTLELPVVTPYVDGLDERLAVHKKALLERGLQAGYVSVKDWDDIDGDVLIVNGKRIELGKHWTRVKFPPGAVILAADPGSKGRASVSLRDGSGTVYSLLLNRGESLGVSAK